jgi:putative (di)nucleoside polyphosphate hydrolase
MTDFIDTEGFRANVGIVLIRDDRQVFLGGRTGGRGWQFPQGGVQRNEAPEQALYRELKEEIGLDQSDVELVAATRHWLRYRLPAQYVRKNAQPRCIGQKQRWFMLRFKGSEDRLHFDSTSAPEFDRWRWVDYWTPVREVIYFKRAVYVRALDELAQRAWPNDPPALPEWSSQEKNLRNLVRRRQLAEAEPLSSPTEE